MSKLKKVHDSVAGIDIGACKFYVGIENDEVQNFETFTSGCHEVVIYYMIC